MTLAELFNATNLAGIRLANLDGRLQLRPAAAVTAAIKAAAAEHKTAILALLPPVPPIINADDKSPASVPEPGTNDPSAGNGELTVAATLNTAVAGNPRPCVTADAKELPLVEERERIAQRASAVLDAIGYSTDPDLRRRQFAATEAIDAAWMANDLAGMSRAVEEFVHLASPANSFGKQVSNL